MGNVVTPGWYRDPARRHEFRYWDGGWSAAVSDHGSLSQDELTDYRFAPPGGGDRTARWALVVLFGGGALALAASVLWAVQMKISPTLNDEDRVRGWTAVLRAVPTAIIAWAVPIVAMLLAVKACRRGSIAFGRTVIWLCGAVLFIVSVSIIGDTIESAIRGSHPELKWLLLPVSIAISAVGTFLAFRASGEQPDQP